MREICMTSPMDGPQVQLLPPNLHRLSRQLRSHRGGHVSLHAATKGRKRRRPAAIRMRGGGRPPTRRGARPLRDLPIFLQVSMPQVTLCTKYVSKIILTFDPLSVSIKSTQPPINSSEFCANPHTVICTWHLHTVLL